MLALVAQTVLAGAVTRALAVVLLAETAVVAGIGLWQQWTHTLFFADDLQFANAYTSFFRVSSIFKDSSIYGRFLVLGIAVLLVLLWLDRIRPAHGLPLLGFLLAGLYFSYSQTSFVSLVAAVLVIGLIAGDRVARRALLATTAALVLVAVVAVLVVAKGRIHPPRHQWTRPARVPDAARLPRPPRRRRRDRGAASRQQPARGREGAEEPQRLAHDAADGRRGARRRRARCSTWPFSPPP